MNARLRAAAASLLLAALCACSIGSPVEPPTVLPRPPATTATPAPPTAPAVMPTAVPPQYVLITKSRGAYWEAVAQGAQAAAQQLGLPPGSVIAYMPEQEDAAAQIIALESFAARGVRGIAIAPVEPRALELSINRAREAGLWVTTFDSDAPNSQRIFFVSTLQRSIGQQSAGAMLALLNGRTGAIALGSSMGGGDAAARIAAFKAGLQTGGLTILDGPDDHHDLGAATQAARSALGAQKDLVGALGVFGYNGLAWCRAVRDGNAAERIAVVAFDVTEETVECLKNGGIDALVSPRPYEQGAQSVLALDALARRGLFEAASELRVPLGSASDAWLIDTGADVISLDGRVGQSLAEYAVHLKALGVPHTWTP